MKDAPPTTLVYPYYENPDMLAHQVSIWNRYAGTLKHNVELVVVDDCSQKAPALPIMKECKLKNRLYRFKERLPWNQHQARNLGAQQASREKENRWLFMSDIDIVLTAEMAYTMLVRNLDESCFYMMERTFAPDFVDRKVHPNTFLVKYAAYWQINGYDVDLTGGFGGGYGGDGEFIRQLEGICTKKHMKDVVLIGYGRRQRDEKPIIADADTSNLDRAEWNRRYREQFNRKRDSGDMRSRKPIRTPWEQLL